MLDPGGPLAQHTYEELRRIADRLLRRERDGHTLQATDLVHEAYLSLCRQGELRADEAAARRAYLVYAAQAMRSVLVGHARRRGAAKRGSGRRPLTLQEITQHLAVEAPDLSTVDEALSRLEALDPRKARIVELRFFAGCTIDETAEALQVSAATVERDWQFARAWLASEIERGEA